jgi:hypothetical protein
MVPPSHLPPPTHPPTSIPPPSTTPFSLPPLHFPIPNSTLPSPYPHPFAFPHHYLYPGPSHGSINPMGWFPATPPPPPQTITNQPTHPPECSTQVSKPNTNTNPNIYPQPRHIHQNQTQHKPDPKHNKPLIIDNKSFLIPQVGGRNYPFCILERKFGKLLGKIWIGAKDIEWLATTIDFAINHGTARNFFKHRRDGYKALHVVQQSNRNDHFLEISEFHSGSRQGVIRLPEGKARHGWRDFALLCRRFWDREALAKDVSGTNGHRNGVRAARNGEESRAPRITSSTPNFEKHVTVAVKSALGDLANKTVIDLGVNARVEIRLDLILECGPGGIWTVSQAQLVQPNAQAPQKPKPQTTKALKQPIGPAPPTNKIWRPKATHAVNTSLEPESSGVVSLDLHLENSLVMDTQLISTTSSSEVNATSSSKSRTPEPSTNTWALLLQEGKWLFVSPPADAAGITDASNSTFHQPFFRSFIGKFGIGIGLE